MPSDSARLSGTAPRAARRSTAEVKSLILDAALQVFTDHGFALAKTRDIADVAGVSEPVIFRHFESKSRLFELVVLQSVSEFMQEFADRFESSFNRRPHDPTLPVAEFVRGLYDLLYEKRKIMRVYLSAASLGEVEGIPAGDDLLGRLLRGFEPIGVEEFGFLKLPDIDIPVSVRAAFGMVMSLAVYGDTMFPSNRHPGRDRILAECTRLLVDGWAHRR
jgi:AcrR family transcriptional regulator